MKLLSNTFKGVGISIYHMSNNDIQNYIDTIKDSPGKVYGEFVNEMLRSHNELNDFNKYMKNSLSKLICQSLVFHHFMGKFISSQ